MSHPQTRLAHVLIRHPKIKNNIMSGSFDRREEDFASLKEYNDHLERYEDLLFELCQDPDIQAVNKRIE